MVVVLLSGLQLYWTFEGLTCAGAQITLPSVSDVHRIYVKHIVSTWSEASVVTPQARYPIHNIGRIYTYMILTCSWGRVTLPHILQRSPNFSDNSRSHGFHKSGVSSGGVCGGWIESVARTAPIDKSSLIDSTRCRQNVRRAQRAF